MANPQSIALALLTATYSVSDSENEDEIGEKDLDNNISISNEESLSPPLIRPIVEVGSTNTVARLVSYNDDLVISEDENDINESERQKSNVEGNDDIQLPPEPSGRCSNELQDKISRYYDKMVTSGLDMNYIIQQRKDFRNPSIYEKLIQFCSIKEFGTNYSPEIYDPLRWGKESYYEELAKVQKTEMDRREKERKEKTKVEFVVGTAKRSTGGSNPGSETDDKKRKTKWDQVGAAATQLGIVKPPGLAQQSALTTSATGTKGIVLSAFGSLPKKN
uniref:SAP30-binding protein n=1 Tax=Clastoptera arizonana TaxID=38151 RepID=A0A1B6DMQ4_9HEMI